MEQFFPMYFQEFQLFRMLLEKKEIIGELTGYKLKLEENLFNTVTCFINDTEYPILKEDTLPTLYNEVYDPILRILIQEQRYHLLKNAMDTSQIWNTEEFQEFVKTGKFESKETEQSMEFYTLIFSEELGESVGYYEDYDKMTEFVDDDLLKDLTVSFIVIDQDGEENELIDWKSDPKLRVRALVEPSSNPNINTEDMFNLFYLREDGINAAKEHPLVSEYYSDFEQDRVAFNIKCYDDFVPEKLVEIGYFDSTTEQEHREQALETFLENVKEYVSPNYAIRGRSDGYVVLWFDELIRTHIEKVGNILEKALKEEPKYYSDIRNYDLEDILCFILDKKEEAELNEDEEELQELEAFEKEIRTLMSEQQAS